MLSAECMYQLPVEVRNRVAIVDVDVYFILYMYDTEFKEYIQWDKSYLQFVTVMRHKIRYKISNDVYVYRYFDGTEKWFNGNQCHNTRGPAIITADGRKKYYINGKLHRTDGPTVTWKNGTKEYYINGKKNKISWTYLEKIM